MLLAAVCLVLVAMVTAQAPQPCCLPETYTIMMRDLRTYGSRFTGSSEVSVDNPEMKVGIKVFSLSGGTGGVVRRVVMDFKAKKLYNIILPVGHCIVNPFHFPYLGNCIPRNATLLGTSYIGEMATLDTRYHDWRFPLGGATGATMTVAVDQNCVPIVQRIHGMLGSNQVDEIMLFSGYRAGISDPSIFDIPPSCQ